MPTPNDSEKNGGLSARITPDLITPAFQPIVDLAQGAIAGFETLSRPGASSGFANAGELFDWAESKQLLWRLEEMTRKAGLQAAVDWPEDVLLFINSTPQVFADRRFAHAILKAVKRVPSLTPSRIVLEITERSDQQYIEGLEQQVKLVKDFGFQIAIDDVGAGTSGLNRILALRPNWLKLDRDMVERIDQDRARQNLLRFFMHFARLSGVRLVAEGIEREAELATLIEIGIPYAQGYFLGEPGSRDQTLSPELQMWLRRRWDEADGTRLRDPEHLRITRFARGVETVSAQSLVRDVASELLRHLSTPGFAVLDGKRYVGWCDREQVLRAAGDVRSSQPIAFLVTNDPTTATPETTIAEALDIALCRDDRNISQPLILSEKGRITGMVGVRDMLHAATTLTNHAHGRSAPLTGLPGRVRSDEHLSELFAREQIPAPPASGSPGRRFDAAFIDIRNFKDYNGAFGYDLGDLLLKRLTGMIQHLIVRTDTDVFVGHLGDDRFLVTAPSKVLERRLASLTRQFDSVVEEYLGVNPIVSGPRQCHTPAETPPEDSQGSGLNTVVGLRVLMVPGAFSRLRSAKELYRRAEQLRALASAQAESTSPGTGASVIVLDRPEDSWQDQRRSA